MTEHLFVLLVCLAVIAVLAILIYASSCNQASALEGVYEVRLALQQILANAQEIDRSLAINAGFSTTPTSESAL